MFNFEKEKRAVAGIGSALVDILINENDDFLEKTGAVKGGMTYVDTKFIDQTALQAGSKPSVVPGGSACNTIIGVGKLGGKARFIGKSGSGDMGSFFESNLRENNVDPVLFKSASPTGRVLSIITPDAQRSMFTYLGAASEATADEITKDCFNGAAIVHIEGYLLFNRELMTAALKAAKSAGALVSLDLASFTVVEESKDYLEKITDEYIDILIANEDEAKAFTGFGDESKAVCALSKKAEISVLKVGARGSYIAHDNKVIKVEPKGNGAAVDTTGAGDLWASGFLFGLSQGFSLEKSGQIGSWCGYEVCQVIGAEIPEQGWQRIKELI